MKTAEIAISATLLACGAMTGCSTGPSATVERFYRLTEAKEVGKAIELVSTSTRSTFGDAKMKAVLLDQASKMQAKGGITSIALSGEQVINDSAKVASNIVFGGGGSSSDTVRLVRENGKWKIAMRK